MPDVEHRLGKIEDKLDAIHETLAKMAIQGEQIVQLSRQQDNLWRKYDKMQEEIHNLQSGEIAKILAWQASCPRTTIKWIWYVVIPMGLTLLAIAANLSKAQ
jgi:SMC interacting uncharacterized protein involved in chromosome segregation